MTHPTDEELDALVARLREPWSQRQSRRVAEEFDAAARDLVPALLKERDDLRAKLDAAVDALEVLIQQTHICEKELTEGLYHMEFCGESEPLVKARASLAKIKGADHD